MIPQISILKYDTVKKVLKELTMNILADFYRYASTALLLSALAMFGYLFYKKEGIKKTVKIWIEEFLHSSDFRRTFLFMFYLSLVLCRTLLYRSLWHNPLARIMEGWGIYGSDGNIDLEGIENFILFIPITTLFWWKKCHKSEYKISFLHLVTVSVAVSFLFSLFIELCQLFFRVGTFQYSDLVYNTAGGLVGGLIYYVFYIIKKVLCKSHTDAL